MNDHYDGTDYVYDSCACRSMVKHGGDESKHQNDSYTCRCRTTMRTEHDG